MSNPNITNKMLRFIEISSALGKEAMDKIEELEGQQKQASAVQPGLVEHLIETKVIDAGQKQAAENALRDPAQTQVLLKNAASKIKELREKSASSAVTQMGRGEGPEKAAYDPNDSLTSPFVGRKTSNEKKASDMALLRGLGLA